MRTLGSGPPPASARVAADPAGLSSGAETLLDVRHLGVEFRTKNGRVVAVEDVSFKLAKSGVLAVVGESGSGKSVMARAIMGLLADNVTVSGSVRLGGDELIGLPEKALRRVRGLRIGLVLQDPLRALDPTMKIGPQIGETLRTHLSLSRAQTRRRVVELMREVRISFPEERYDHYPHQFSGGMRQRAAIAMALACDPELLIADEPTTALDASTQVEIMTLLRRLRRERELTVLFVSHDLTLAADMADEIAVMYGGRLLERLPADRLRSALVPYTRSLLEASPGNSAQPRTHLPVIPGQPLSRRGAMTGCVFAGRCPDMAPPCATESPRTELVDGDSHEIRCWHPVTDGRTA